MRLCTHSGSRRLIGLCFVDADHLADAAVERQHAIAPVEALSQVCRRGCHALHDLGVGVLLGVVLHDASNAGDLRRLVVDEVHVLLRCPRYRAVPPLLQVVLARIPVFTALPLASLECGQIPARE